VPEGHPALDWHHIHDLPKKGRHCMTWTKPEFEVIDLCSEVTSYLYKR
jgi:hypothetical protein